MSETINSSQIANIQYPELGRVEIPHSVDWVYIMRKDGKFAMEPIAEKLASEAGNQEDIQVILEEEYDIFFSQLADTFINAYSDKGTVELHLFEADKLENVAREKASGFESVSLDPMMNTGVHEIKVSRGYYSGGIQDITLMNRPGSEPLPEQAKKVRAAIPGDSVNVFEDDIFSGGSLGKALDLITDSGLKVNKIIPGIQVGKPEKITKMGIDVDPVVQYEVTPGIDIFDKVDLGDPRDYLVGASGLVIKMPNGDLGRVPYIPPFVSSTARAGIPKEQEMAFAEKVLLMNYSFFERAEEKLGRGLQLKHMDPHFGNYMHQIIGIDKDTPMKTVIGWLMENNQRIWDSTVQSGELQKKIEDLQLPANLIFIDVNGTLIPSDFNGEQINPDSLEKFKEQVMRLQESGCAIGLCSDSPLQQLAEFAETIGLTNAPIIYENGNGIANNDVEIVLRKVEKIEEIKKKIVQAATDQGISQSEDCIAVEFGGTPPDTEKNKWAFGANRQTSISVFGPPDFINSLGTAFAVIKDASVDCSPEYNYFAVHPGAYKQNKGVALQMLSSYGHNVIMIGDSMSDSVDKQSGVICTFVGNHRLAEHAKKDAAVVSEKDTINGVIEILNKIQIQSK